MTGRHRGPKRKLQAGYTALSQCHYNSILCAVSHICAYWTSTTTHPIYHHQVWYCVLSLRYACTRKFGHHPHPYSITHSITTFVQNFVSFAELAPWRKIVYSITQSLTQLAWFPGNRSLRFGITHKTRNFTPTTCKYPVCTCKLTI